MKKFKIEVQEILSKIIEIEATDIDQAIYEVKKMYESEEIILNENDYITTEFTNYERPRIFLKEKLIKVGVKDNEATIIAMDAGSYQIIISKVYLNNFKLNNITKIKILRLVKRWYRYNKFLYYKLKSK